MLCTNEILLYKNSTVRVSHCAINSFKNRCLNHMHGQQIVYTICVSFYNLMGYCRVCELFTWMNLVTIQLGYHMSSTLPAADLQVIFGAPAAADPWTIPNTGGIYICISLRSLPFLTVFIRFAIRIFFPKEKCLRYFPESDLKHEMKNESALPPRLSSRYGLLRPCWSQREGKHDIGGIEGSIGI